MNDALKSSLLPLFTFICAAIVSSGAVGCAPAERSFATGDGGSAGSGQGGDTPTSGQGGSGGSGQGGAGGGQGGQGGAPALCLTDADCLNGAEWCSGGSCVACDNSGLMCDIKCENGWQTYTRNGCYPCACAPPNACSSDSDCAGDQCYAGKFCWDWCPPGDPTCCYGNTCSSAGCTVPNPAGCVMTGCPLTDICVTVGVCASSSCGCLGEGWGCTKDCAGGKCVPLE